MSQYCGTGRLSTHQSAAYTTTAGQIATVIGAGVKKARIEVTSAAFVKVGVSAAATTSDVYMPANAPETVTVAPGERVSAVQVTSAGTLHVTEIP